MFDNLDISKKSKNVSYKIKLNDQHDDKHVSSTVNTGELKQQVHEESVINEEESKRLLAESIPDVLP